MNGVRVTVVGAGLMGHGIAQVAACAGADVTIQDPAHDVLRTVPERVAGNLRALGADATPARSIRLVDDLEAAVSDAHWVFEAAPEDMALKQELFERMDAAAPEDCILASNSSVMRITEIAARSRRPERTVGTHWWNPPYLVPLVEVVRGERSSEATIAGTIELLEAFGKTAVRVERDVPGFVGNRLQHALWREAFNLVDAGVCDAPTVDTVVKASFGRRLGVLGPIENADLIGLDLTLAIHDYILPRLDPPSEPSAGLRERVARGDLGMRTGLGFRSWSQDAADDLRRQVLDVLSKGAEH